MIFQMRFEITFFESGLGATISNEHVHYKEIWLAESLRAAWTVWAELGWESPDKTKIEDRDWKLKNISEEKRDVIEKMLRLERISRYQDFDINTNFEQGGEMLLEIVAAIKNNSFYFDPFETVAQFRHVITLYLATGIKKGLEMADRGASERFIHSIRDYLGGSPIEFPTNAEVYFNRFQKETIVSVTGTPESEVKLNCDYITVEP